MTLGDPLAGGSSRFQIRRRIGAGSFGIVYEAFDPVRNNVVAVKALRQATPDALYRFKREFRSLSDIAERNLVRLYELISEGDQWLVSMELIRGRNFIEYVRGAPFARGGDEPVNPYDTQNARVDLARLNLALPQLATGLIALHNAGKLHRDIKPSNVLVSDEQRVVLLDFGLILDTDMVDYTAATSGTPAYMSPEQGAGESLTAASDWYSVGVMLYEALVGRVPFHGTWLDVLNAKRAGDVAPPSSVMPGVPPHLDDLCRDLLRVDPRTRPPADEIMRRLGGPAPRITSASSAARPFVGRDRHLRMLREAFDATVEGVQTTICVQGASGAGKTALIRAFVEQLREEVPDLLVLTGRCYQRESVPYKGIDSLVDALHRYLSRLDPAEIDALLPRDIAAAEQLFPVLRDLGDLMRMRRRHVPPLVPDQQELRRRAFATIRELLVRLADRTRLIVVIDDLQWGDVDSAELLEEILRPPDAPPLLFIAAYRADAAATSPFLPTFRDRVAARDLPVEPLTPDESRHLALQLLGDSVPHPDEVATLVTAESGGSPFFIDELVRAFAMAGPAVTALRRGTGASEDRDDTIRQVLQVRLRALEPNALGLLQMISVHARPILRAPLHRALSGGEFEKTLTTLAAQHLIRTRETVEGEAVEPYHDRIAEAAMAMLNQEELRQRHAQLAAALEKFEADAELLADHFLAAGLHDRAAVYVERAAEKAAAAVAFDRAARLYRRALTLNPENGDALRRRLAEILVNAGRGPEAASELLAVEPRDFADGLELRRSAAQQLLVSGHVDEGLTVIRTILASVDIPWPESRRETIRTLLALRLKLRLRGLRFRERAASEIPAHELLRVDACRAVALGLSSVDPIRGAAFQSRYLLLALEAGDPHRVAHALIMECGYSAVGGTKARRRTEKLTARMREIAERLATPYARAFADEAEGVVASLQGRWREGAERLEEAERAFVEHCTGVSFELNTARLFGMRCRQFRGDLKVMAERFPSLLRDAEDRGDRYFATSIVLFSHYVYLADDDPACASERIDSAIHEWSHAGFHVQHVWHLRAAVEIALYEGQGLLAWTRLSQAWQTARSSLVTRVQFTRMVLEDVRGRAALAAAAQTENDRERERFLAIAGEAAGRLEDEDAEWGRALAMLLRGRLTEAEPLLEQVEMHLHAAAVRMRLGNPAGREWMLAQGIRNPEAMARLLLP